MIKFLYIIFLIISNLGLFLLNKKDTKNVLINIVLLTINISIIVAINMSLTIFLLVYLINIIILLFINRNNKKNSIKKIIYKLYILLCISIIVELTLFNYRSYTTCFNKSENAFSYDNNTNLKKIGKSTYKVIEETPIIEIKNINKHIDNIYLDIIDQNLNTYYAITFFTDKGNKLYQQLESREINSVINKSKTLNFNFSGKSKKLKLEFTFQKNDIIKINKIILNYKIPIETNIIRIILLFIILVFIELFGYKSKLYQINYENFKYKKLVIISFIILIACSFMILSIGTIKKINNNTSDINNQMASSLLEGKTYFTSGNHSEELLSKISNPYDTNLREKIFKENNATYLWDCAFYKGHYYSYFGVVPVICYYIPFLLLFKSRLQTPILVLFLSIISAILLILLLHQVVVNYFKKCSLGLFMMLGIVLIYCTGLLYFLKLPEQYSLPIVTGLQFTYLGLNLIIWAINKPRFQKTKMFLGALSLALVAGCRPQLLMGSFILIPLAIIYLKRKPEKKEIISSILVICIPYIIIAILQMYYNHIRFGSVFDFGANYNLTTNDMTSRGFKIDRIPLGIVMYLFNPVNIKNTFPYIIETKLSTNYLGTTIYEPIYGGIFFSVIVTSINLYILKLKKYIKNKIVFNTCLLLIISSFIIIIVDTQMAGILARYITDFSWLLVFSAILIILSLYSNSKLNKKWIIRIVFFLISISLIYQFFYYFVSVADHFKNDNWRFWLEFFYAVQFWI